MTKIERKQKIGFGSFGKMELSFLEGAVISSFFPEGKDMTIKEIIERLDNYYSYERVNSTLKSMADKKIVKEDKKGKTLVYFLDMDHLYSETGFDHYMLQREIDFMKKNKIVYNAIKEIMNNHHIWMVVLFGSYSKGTESNQSDVDIICVSTKNKEIEHFVKSLKYKYNLEFAPIILSPDEFPNIKKDNLELWNDLKMYGIVFKGEDTFYYWMYKDEKN
ncbi:MAG: nucleotidyltransferase domain-containing protein [Nanoarchaeota archaeon]|nr:nucleotidyltransferase domain-containing protein [Nanoarchaeota archaeon]